MERHEFPSLWETQEIQNELLDMKNRAEQMDSQCGYASAATGNRDPDAGKPRATVCQYAALMGEIVATNLEGLARARLEKKPRAHQTHAEIHQSYIVATSGGPRGPDDEPEGGPADGQAPRLPDPEKEDFIRLRSQFTLEEMQAILDFAHKPRPSQSLKELLEMPFMNTDAAQNPDSESVRHWKEQRRAHGAVERKDYQDLANADLATKLRLKRAQHDALEVNAEEDHIEEVAQPTRRLRGKQPAAASSFLKEGLYETPGAFIRHLISELPADKRLTREQECFMVVFAKACDEAWEDEKLPPKQRRVHDIHLLGAGGTGKTHVVQNLVFKAVEYIWPDENADSPSMMVVASSNAQAKNISTAKVKARTLHNAAGMRVQEMTNPKMRPGDKAKSLEQRWRNVMVLIIEEVSMVSAASYNMVDFRAMYGRTKTHEVNEGNYSKEGCRFGRVPILIHLGDFLQLPPTAQLSLVTDTMAKNEDGSYVIPVPPSLEIQNAIKVFDRVKCVIELRGTKRFVPGDPLIQFLECMRMGARIPDPVWQAFEDTFATDSLPEPKKALDPRHAEPGFLEGYGLAMYWEPLARWITKRARRDARMLEVPLVFLQAADQCQTITDNETYSRMLNVANIYKTGRIHGVLPAHVGMRVRFTGKFNGTYGLVQEQRATIVDFVFDAEDQRRYDQAQRARPGEIFRPHNAPAGIWLQVDNFNQAPTWQSLMEHVAQDEDDAQEKREKLARGLFCMPMMETTFTWEASNVPHTVTRFGFMLTHAHYLTTTASQGQTIRAKVTIDCARQEARGQRGANDDTWWLNLYVMFSRATRMSDMLLLRPPPRELLERGPPASVRAALRRFAEKERTTVAEAVQLAERYGITLPEE